MKVYFIGGRADGTFVDRVNEDDVHVWLTDDHGDKGQMKLYFNPPPDGCGNADFYELHRAWPSLRWYYVADGLLDSPASQRMFPDTPSSEAADAL